MVTCKRTAVGLVAAVITVTEVITSQIQRLAFTRRTSELIRRARCRNEHISHHYYHCHHHAVLRYMYVCMWMYIMYMQVCVHILCEHTF